MRLERMDSLVENRAFDAQDSQILGLDDNVVIETEDSLIPSKPSRSSTPADSIFSRT